MSTRSIRVLVADDSATARELLSASLCSAGDIEVIATAADGTEAVSKARELRPDLITMDVHMPGASGLEATRTIMRESPVPIVVVSGIYSDRAAATFDALEAGALAFVRKPPGPLHPDHPRAVAELIKAVRLMSEVKVVRRHSFAAVGTRTERSPGAVPVPLRPPKIIAIGASTGGPAALRELLNALIPDPPLPMMVVQHIAEGFLEGFVSWLSQATSRPVERAEDKAPLRPGYVYVAPDGLHLGVRAGGAIQLVDSAAEAGARPSVAYLFRSVRDVYGASAVGVLLSGMGKDGAAELLALKERGALTFAQSADSALIFGMPGEAVRLGAAMYTMAPASIGQALNGVLSRSSRQVSTAPKGEP